MIERFVISFWMFVIGFNYASAEPGIRISGFEHEATKTIGTLLIVSAIFFAIKGIKMAHDTIKEDE